MSIEPADAPPVPRPCTTARDVRELALEPTLELAATAQREQLLVARIFADTQHPACRELAVLVMGDETHAKRMAGYLDGCATRLDAAERWRSCYVVNEVSEREDPRGAGPSGRTIAAEVRAPLKTLMDRSRRRLEHDKARADLRALLATYGDKVFEPRVTKHLGGAQVLAMRGEVDRVAASA